MKIADAAQNVVSSATQVANKVASAVPGVANNVASTAQKTATTATRLVNKVATATPDDAKKAALNVANKVAAAAPAPVKNAVKSTINVAKNVIKSAKNIVKKGKKIAKKGKKFVKNTPRNILNKISAAIEKAAAEPDKMETKGCSTNMPAAIIPKTPDGYARRQTSSINQTTNSISNGFVLPSINEHSKNPVCASRNGFTMIAGGTQTLDSCKFNASMRFNEYDQQMKMRKMKARNGLSYRTLPSYDAPFSNTQAFTGMYTLPPTSDVNSLFDRAFSLKYIPPRDSSNKIEIPITPGADFSAELFGYVIVKTGGNSTDIKVKVSNIDRDKYVIRTWFGNEAILNYAPSSSQANATVQNNEIVPIRIQFYVRAANTTNIPQYTPTASAKYWSNYPDVANAKYPADAHYKNHGKREGRKWPETANIDKLQIKVFSSGDRDVVGLYTLIENNVPYVMNKYMYGLDRNNCYAISTNKMLEDKRYISVSLFSTLMPTSDNAISIVEKITNVNGKDVYGFVLTIGSKSIEQKFAGIVPRANQEWLAALVSSAPTAGSGSGQTLTATTPVYSQSGYYKVMLVGSRIVVYGYLENPTCSATATAPATNVNALNAYRLDVSPYNNRYSAVNTTTNTLYPITKDKNNLFKDTQFKPALHWSRYNDLFPTNPNNFKRESSPNAEECNKLAAQKGASQTFFVQDSRNTKGAPVNTCYYTTNQPAFGQVSLATNVMAPPQNMSSSLYIRTQADNKGTMPRLNASNYSLGNPYQPIIDAQEEWQRIANMSKRQFNAEFKGGKEGFGEDATLREDAIQNATQIANWGGRSTLVNDANNLITVLGGSLNTLDTAADVKNGNNNGTAVVYDSSRGVSYNDAMDLYNLVHPNTTQTAVSGLEVDSNELKMQYNNLLVVGSIAAATFAISAIVTLSLR